MRYTRVKTIELNESGYTLDYIGHDNRGSYAYLSKGKKQVRAMMHIVYYDKVCGTLMIRNNWDFDVGSGLYSYIILNNRRIVIEYYTGYRKYRGLL